MAAHAVFSPSGAVSWTTCLAGLIHGVGIESADSDHARTGTAAHHLLESLIRHGDESGVPEEYRPLVDDEMREHIADVLATVKDFAGPTGHIFPEQRVNFSTWLDCPSEMGFGTSDVFVLTTDPVTGDAELQVHDLKYGMGILVTAENNMQLQLYALGALLEFDWLHRPKIIRLVIHQPRRDHLSEWVTTVDDLVRFSVRMRAVVQLYLRIVREGLPVTEDLYAPGEAACQFCRIKATCPALAAAVYKGAAQDRDLVLDIALGTNTYRTPVDVTPEEMGNRVALLPLVQQWATATKAEALRRLLNGEPVQGFKVVRSKGGRRNWSDEKDVEGALRIWRLPAEQTHTVKLRSPAQLEKVVSKKKHPDRWALLQQFITKKPGSPAIAPESDPRPVLDNITPDDFEDIGEEE